MLQGINRGQMFPQICGRPKKNAAIVAFTEKKQPAIYHKKARPGALKLPKAHMRSGTAGV
jgi:hypothetical protein